MNAVITLHQFEQLAQQDTAFLSIVQSMRGYAMLWVNILAAIFLRPIVFLIAPIIPRIFRDHLNYIYPALPYIQDRKSLEWLRDTFLLYYFSLKGYRSAALFKNKFDLLMEELDEHIDSLNYVLENEKSISDTLKGHKLIP